MHRLNSCSANDGEGRRLACSLNLLKMLRRDLCDVSLTHTSPVQVWRAVVTMKRPNPVHGALKWTPIRVERCNSSRVFTSD
jgi:hypothetical protein